MRPCPDDADDDRADNEGNRDGPGADANAADYLAMHLILRDLAIAGFLLRLRIAHRPVPWFSAGASLPESAHACMTFSSRLLRASAD